jgi:hypothetical protein
MLHAPNNLSEYLSVSIEPGSLVFNKSLGEPTRFFSVAQNALPNNGPFKVGELHVFQFKGF